jgi:SAM-dependent methyltransferase
MSEMPATDRSDTAHLHWDKQWQTAEGRADWLEPDPGVLAFATERFETGDRLALDLGCGVGRHALALAEIGFKMSAMDGSPSGLDELAKTAAARNLDIAIRQAEMTDLPYEDGAFDYVLSFNVIYHGDPKVVQAAVSEIARVLKPGGYFQGTMLSKRNRNFGLGREIAPSTFVNEGDADKAHPHFYCSAAELTQLFEAFELLKLEDRLHKKPGSWHWHLIASAASSSGSGA